jgi:SAM-dependent methyltransferase
MDWGEGCYECIGVDVVPAAEVVVDAARLRAGEHVVDVGCGDGNASLIAAERGARVTGIDPATRLLEVARMRAAERSLDAVFVEGVAESIPLPDGAADVIVSVFAMIFTADPAAAAEEAARVTAPGGRVVLSAWHPRGALAEASRLRRETVARASGTTKGGPPPFAWHDVAALRDLFEPHGFKVSAMDVRLPFTSASTEAFVERDFAGHPGWTEAGRVLDARSIEELRAEILQVFAEANEDPGAFRVTSDYMVATMHRG